MKASDTDRPQRGIERSNGDALGERVAGMGRDAAAAAKQQADAVLTDAKRGAADAANETSGAIDSLAASLADSGQDTLSRAAGALSGRLQTFAGYLEGQSLDGLMRDARRMAQRNPALFVAGGVAIGFALTRFFKASAEPATLPTPRTH